MKKTTPNGRDMSYPEILVATSRLELNTEPPAFGLYLKLIRIARGLSAEKFGEMFTRSVVDVRPSVYRMVSGFMQPPREKLNRIAHELGYPVSAFDRFGKWMADGRFCHVLAGAYSDGNEGHAEGGMYLRLARTRRGVSQLQIELNAQVTHNLLVQYENGKTDALDYFHKRNIADILGYPYGLLFAPEEEMRRRTEYLL